MRGALLRPLCRIATLTTLLLAADDAAPAADGAEPLELYDSSLGPSDRAIPGGRAPRVAQRARFPVRLGGLTWTPWIELAQRTRKVGEGAPGSSGFASGPSGSYSASSLNGAEASIGLDAASDPVAVSPGTRLVLFAGASYTQGLVGGREVLAKAEPGLGFAPQAVADGPVEPHALGFSLGARLSAGTRLTFGARLDLTADASGGITDEVALLHLGYRF